MLVLTLKWDILWCDGHQGYNKSCIIHVSILTWNYTRYLKSIDIYKYFYYNKNLMSFSILFFNLENYSK